MVPAGTTGGDFRRQTMKITQQEHDQIQTILDTLLEGTRTGGVKRGAVLSKIGDLSVMRAMRVVDEQKDERVIGFLDPEDIEALTHALVAVAGLSALYTMTTPSVLDIGGSDEDVREAVNNLGDVALGLSMLLASRRAGEGAE